MNTQSFKRFFHVSLMLFGLTSMHPITTALGDKKTPRKTLSKRPIDWGYRIGSSQCFDNCFTGGKQRATMPFCALANAWSGVHKCLEKKEREGFIIDYYLVVSSPQCAPCQSIKFILWAFQHLGCVAITGSKQRAFQHLGYVSSAMSKKRAVSMNILISSMGPQDKGYYTELLPSLEKMADCTWNSSRENLAFLYKCDYGANEGQILPKTFKRSLYVSDHLSEKSPAPKTVEIWPCKDRGRERTTDVIKEYAKKHNKAFGFPAMIVMSDAVSGTIENGTVQYLLGAKEIVNFLKKSVKRYNFSWKDVEKLANALEKFYNKDNKNSKCKC